MTFDFEVADRHSGGHVEEGEDPNDTIVREIKEEYQILAKEAYEQLN